MMVFMFTYLECNECTCNQHLIMTQQASSACFETLKTISLSLSFSLPLAHSIAYTHTHTHTSPQLPWERVGWNSPGQKRIADRKACQKRTSTDGLPTSFNLGVGGGWGRGGGYPAGVNWIYFKLLSITMSLYIKSAWGKQYFCVHRLISTHINWHSFLLYLYFLQT